MRLIRGLAALLALLAGVVGVPVFLIMVVGNPLPADGGWSDVVVALTRPDDGSFLVGLVSVVAWVAWLIFTLSVTAEVAAAISRWRFRLRLPGLAGPQRLASGLVLAVIALAVVTPQPSHGSPVRETPQVAPRVPQAASQHVDDAGPASAGDQGHRRADAADGQSTGMSSAHQHGTPYVVQPGDDLWSLAERFYGEGQRWRSIAAANPERLTGGPDRLEPGWTLLIPDAGTHSKSSGHLVQRGDSLSSIARHSLGDSTRWPELYDANRFQLDDPDELPLGLRLVVPPAAAKDAPERAPRAARTTTPRPADSDEHPRDNTSASGPVDREPDALPRPQAEPGNPEVQADAPAASTPIPSGVATPPETTAARSPDADAGSGESSLRPSAPIVAGIAGVGGLLAAAVLAATAARRRLQLQARPVGRRVPRPAAVAQLAEAHLGRRQRPMGLRTLDLATRAIAAHCHDTGAALPELLTAVVADDSLALEMSEPDVWAPDAFVVAGCSWRLDAVDVDRLRSTPGLPDAVRPYPALVTLGTTDEGSQVVADLESLRLTSIDASDDELAEAALAAMAVELGCSPWAEELELILVGTCDRLPAALGQHAVTEVDDLGPTLDQLAQRAAAQRRQLPERSVASHRIDPDLADPWVPTILIVNRELSMTEARRLRELVLADPPVSIAAVVRDLPDAPNRIVLSGSPAAPTARVEPFGLAITPQLLSGVAAEAVIDLVETTGRVDTAPAPWWFDEEESTDPDPPDNVTYLGRRFGGWVRTNEPDDHDQEGAAMDQQGESASHPMLRLLGPVELEGAAGAAPTRAAKQCLEYCAWLLEYPGTTAQAMATALAVAEGTRRSNMSRLRAWLGTDELEQPYLPDAYSGRIVLHPSVSSDWQRLQILTGRGVNRTSTSGLEAALRLVRGAPLADAAPGQWHWAEGLRTDMISVIRDLGVELADRALADGDVELARWAATRALLAAPGDELLVVARIKTEHRAGNYPEVERLTLQLAAHARTLEVDLRPETVDVLQEMMEGRVRARLA